MCILSALYALLKVFGYYDLSVLSMSVIGFQKKVWMGVGGWGELHPIFFLDFWNFFNFAKPLKRSWEKDVDDWMCLQIEKNSRRPKDVHRSSIKAAPSGNG